MSQNLDTFIDLFNDEGHTYSLKREEPWTTAEAYIYVDRSAKVQLEPEVRCVEIGALSSFTKERCLETHLSPSRPIFKKIYEKANLSLWFAYEREQEREDEDTRRHARERKDVRLRKPGT